MTIINTKQCKPDADAYVASVPAGQRPGAGATVAARGLQAKSRVSVFGINTLIGGAMRLRPVKTAFALLSQQIGAKIKAVLFERHGAAGDVDSVTDLHIADSICAQRNFPEADGAGSPSLKPDVAPPARQTTNTRTDWRDTLEAMCEG